MPYKTQSPDTSPEMEKVYFDLLRQKSTVERWRGLRALTQSAIRREWTIIAREHQDWDDQEVRLHWMKIVYGEELSNRVREYMQSRERIGVD